MPTTTLSTGTTPPAPAITVLTNGQQVYCTSLNVADVFEKRHDNVMRDISRILEEYPEEFGLLNFEESFYVNNQNKKQPCYHLTKDGFMTLVMGFTGKKAA